jgi:hypothetical protein
VKAHGIWKIWGIAAGFALAACSSNPSRHAPPYAESLKRAWSEQAACTASWEGLLEEWERSGGGVKATLRQTRQQVAADQHSRFARLVRRAWSLQAVTASAADSLEPLPPEVSRAATIAVAHAAEGIVRPGCEPPIYLGNWWNRALGAHRPEDMPATVSEDLWAQRVWLQGWLFVRLAGEP